MSKLGEFVLRKLSRNPRAPDYLVKHYESRRQDVAECIRQLQHTFPTIGEQIQGKQILDIGCADGVEAIALWRLGASEVVGIDIQIDEKRAETLKRSLAPESRVRLQRCDAHHTPFPDELFDGIVTISSLEHFADPQQVLKECMRLLRPGGRVYLTSGVWYHPYGAHMHFFTRLPWVQVFFTEETIMNVRSLYRSDGAKHYREVEGGLNRIGIQRFLRYVRELDFKLEFMNLDPVRGLTFLTKIPFLKEFFTNLIIATLRKGP